MYKLKEFKLKEFFNIVSVIGFLFFIAHLYFNAMLKGLSLFENRQIQQINFIEQRRKLLSNKNATTKNVLKEISALKLMRPPMRPASRIYPMHHIHIPKNSGSSLQKMLEENIPSGRVFCKRCKRHRECIEDFYSLTKEMFQPCDVLTTHMPFGFPERFTKKKYVQVVILRDPLERAQSYYDYVKKSGDHYNNEDVMRNSIDKILKRSFNKKIERATRHNLVFFNEQTWFLCGHRCQSGKMSLEDALKRAKANLLESCEFVGVTENLDPFLQRLRSVYSWLPQHFITKNAHTRNHTVFSGPIEDMAKKLFWADIELHRFAALINKIDSVDNIENAEDSPKFDEDII